jgi:hypothetical protein
MKQCMILMGRYSGQVLSLDDTVASGAVTDGWAVDLTDRFYPYEVTILPGGNRPQSLRTFEYQISTGRVGTEGMHPSPILHINKGAESVITVAQSEASKFASADSIYIEGTGNAKFDGIVFGGIVVDGPNITLINYTNPTEVNNQGTVIRTDEQPEIGPKLTPFYPLIHDPNPERKRT